MLLLLLAIEQQYRTAQCSTQACSCSSWVSNHSCVCTCRFMLLVSVSIISRITALLWLRRCPVDFTVVTACPTAGHLQGASAAWTASIMTTAYWLLVSPISSACCSLQSRLFVGSLLPSDRPCSCWCRVALASANVLNCMTRSSPQLHKRMPDDKRLTGNGPLLCVDLISARPNPQQPTNPTRPAGRTWHAFAVSIADLSSKSELLALLVNPATRHRCEQQTQQRRCTAH